MINPVYFDNAATTQMHDAVVEAMSQIMKSTYGNPSSTHSFGRSAKALLEKARKTVAGYLNAAAGEIIFTSGGTEANNLILKSAVKDLKVTHIITSRIEHHAVLHTVEALHEQFGIRVSYVNVDAQGSIDTLQLETLLQTEAKTLVSLMHINNEIGNILDLKLVAELCQANDALFHTDAVQSIGHYKLDLQALPIDFLVASAHKFHGPKGVGFAFIRKNSELQPTTYGGEQERGLRAGTEGLYDIIGLETALKIAYNNLNEDTKYIQDLKSYFIKRCKAEIPGVKFNGLSADFDASTYALVNVCLPITSVQASMIVFQLDLKGIACSRGSACQSGSDRKSHVLAEILKEDDLKLPSVRFSFSVFNSLKEVDYVVDTLKSFL